MNFFVFFMGWGSYRQKGWNDDDDDDEKVETNKKKVWESRSLFHVYRVDDQAESYKVIIKAHDKIYNKESNVSCFY